MILFFYPVLSFHTSICFSPLFLQYWSYPILISVWLLGSASYFVLGSDGHRDIVIFCFIPGCFQNIQPWEIFTGELSWISELTQCRVNFNECFRTFHLTEEKVWKIVCTIFKREFKYFLACRISSTCSPWFFTTTEAGTSVTKWCDY